MKSRLDRETVLAALELAVRAPSALNAQPWRFRIGRDRIDLFADPTRTPPGTDPDGRDLLLSCGAALHHLRIGLVALGWLPATRRLPDPDRPDLLATVETRAGTPTRADLTLAVSIPRRRTDRRPYRAREVSGDRLAELVHLAAAEGAELHRMTTRADDPATLLVVGTAADDRLSRLRAGEATSAVLLAATRLRLATCPLTRPLEHPAIRDLVRTDVLGDRLVPQLVVRVGWPPEDLNPFPITRRRPISAVLDWPSWAGVE